jgi:carboxyl-terminal processing protease
MKKSILSAVAAGILIGVLITSHAFVVSPSSAAISDTFRQLDLFGQVFERVRSDYVTEVEDEELIENAINGMLAGLDPHSSYMNARTYRDMQIQTRGEYGGLGMEVTMDEGSDAVRVVAPMDDTPAYRAGIRAGDLITHVDGEQILGQTLTQAIDKMRGRVGTKVTITIRRKDTEPFDLSLTREMIELQAVRHRREDDVGYIRISTFNEKTVESVQRAVRALRREIGDGIKGYVIDVRNNPGGLLDQAIGVTDVFLDGGEIVSTRSRNPKDTQRFNARSGDLTRGAKLVVLTNHGSASGSEIVAGALQDHERAIVLGVRSFGKGSVQTIIPLSGGSQGALRLTTSKYYTPSGRSIQAKGIAPNIEVFPKGATDEEIAELTGEARLRNHLEPEEIEAEMRKAERQVPADQSAEDWQLQRALEILRGIAPGEHQQAAAR